MTLKSLDIAIIKVNPDLSCEVLDCVENEEKAIHFLTKHMNEEYELIESTLFKVYQKSSVSFEVYRVGYLYKTLECKYHIIDLNM